MVIGALGAFAGGVSSGIQRGTELHNYMEQSRERQEVRQARQKIAAVWQRALSDPTQEEAFLQGKTETIPMKKARDWQGLEADIMRAAIETGDVSVLQQNLQAFQGYQQQGFLKNWQAAIARAEAGDLQGASRAARLAYSYFPTGFDADITIAPDGRTLMVDPIDEKTGTPTGRRMALDVQAMREIGMNFRDPNAFMTWKQKNDQFDRELQLGVDQLRQQKRISDDRLRLAHQELLLDDRQHLERLAQASDIANREFDLQERASNRAYRLGLRQEVRLDRAQKLAERAQDVAEENTALGLMSEVYRNDNARDTLDADKWYSETIDAAAGEISGSIRPVLPDMDSEYDSILQDYQNKSKGVTTKQLGNMMWRMSNNNLTPEASFGIAENIMTALHGGNTGLLAAPVVPTKDGQAVVFNPNGVNPNLPANILIPPRLGLQILTLGEAEAARARAAEEQRSALQGRIEAIPTGPSHRLPTDPVSP